VPCGRDDWEGWRDEWDESLADIGENLRPGLILAFVDIMDRYLNLLDA